MAPQDLIIVVDDDQSVRKSLDRLMRSHGFTVRSYASAEAFLDDSPPQPPACAILDLSMPGLDGLELQKQLLKRHIACGVVFLTGRGDLESRIAAMKHDAVDFLTKPVDDDRLVAAVRKSLEEQRLKLEQDVATENARDRLRSLTPREHEVMILVIHGRLNKLIAADLGISEKTVKAHRASVMRKSGVKSVAELVRLYIASNEDKDDEESGPADRD